MIRAAMLLVAAAAAVLVTAVVVAERDLSLVYTSIALCLGAALLLGLGVARARASPARRPVTGAPAGTASWSTPAPARTDPAASEADGRLAAVPGLEPGARGELLARYGDLEGLRHASVAELASVADLPTDLAQRVHEAIHSP